MPHILYFYIFSIFLISLLLIICLFPSYLGVPLRYAGVSINKFGAPESASFANLEVFFCALERRAKYKLLKLKLLHNFKFNITLILVLQIYFIVSSTGEDWQQTINIYNKNGGTWYGIHNWECFSYYLLWQFISSDLDIFTSTSF